MGGTLVPLTTRESQVAIARPGMHAPRSKEYERPFGQRFGQVRQTQLSGTVAQQTSRRLQAARDDLIGVFCRTGSFQEYLAHGFDRRRHAVDVEHRGVDTQRVLPGGSPQAPPRGPRAGKQHALP